MPVNYGMVSKVIGIQIEIFDSRDNPLVDFRLKYETNDGHVQSYRCPTIPKNIRHILTSLRKRRLIPNVKFQENINTVNTLEEKLLLNPTYLAIHNI